MNQEELLKKLNHLKQPPVEVADEYLKKMDRMVAYLNEGISSRDDAVQLLGGEQNLDMMQDNHMNHARFIESILRNFNAEVLLDTVLWVFVAYRSRGFHDTYWAAQLNLWMKTIKEELSPASYEAVLPIYEWMQLNIPHFVALADKSKEKATTPEPSHG